MKLPVFPASHDLALLVLRLWLGVVGFYHGSQKLLGLFGGPGIKGFAGFLADLHVPAPTASAVLAGGSELVGGVLVAVGLLPRLFAIPFLFTMLTAWATAHHFAFDVQQHGGEYPLMIAVALLTIIIAGPGKYAVTR